MKKESLVFNELDFSRLDFSIPVRNPWSEVRLLGFLRGDAYVNPFHDLLYALSRPSHAPLKDRADRPRRQLHFTEAALELRGPNEAERSYPYATLEVLRLEYTQMMDAGGDPYRAGAGVYYLKVVASGAEASLEIRLSAPAHRYRKVLEMLYRRRVKFREFNGGMRSFLMEINVPYRRIQELKAEYDLEW